MQISSKKRKGASPRKESRSGGPKTVWRQGKERCRRGGLGQIPTGSKTKNGEQYHTEEGLGKIVAKGNKDEGEKTFGYPKRNRKKGASKGGSGTNSEHFTRKKGLTSEEGPLTPPINDYHGGNAPGGTPRKKAKMHLGARPRGYTRAEETSSGEKC